MTSEKHDAVVWGAGGFVGGELLRLLACHPHFDLKVALSETYADKPVAEINPQLAGWTNIDFLSLENWSWNRLKAGSWVIFSAQPHTKTMQVLPAVLKELEGSDIKVVDLSGDFRLPNPTTYEKFYGAEHAAPEYLEQFVYGLPEVNRQLIAEADYIANPGCFATCAQLAISPLGARGEKVQFIAIDSKTGSSGAGITPRETTHHPNRMNNFRAYKQLAHQHTPEIVNGWQRAGGSSDTSITFVPQMAPMVRGIFTTAHFFLNESVTTAEVIGRYEDYYKDAPFVRIVEDSPNVTSVWGTNRCDISALADGRTVVVCAAIDNLIKGAAGEAVQCANIACALDETAGLISPTPHPV